LLKSITYSVNFISLRVKNKPQNKLQWLCVDSCAWFGRELWFFQQEIPPTCTSFYVVFTCDLNLMSLYIDIAEILFHKVEIWGVTSQQMGLQLQLYLSFYPARTLNVLFSGFYTLQDVYSEVLYTQKSNNFGSVLFWENCFMFFIFYIHFKPKPAVKRYIMNIDNIFQPWRREKYEYCCYCKSCWWFTLFCLIRYKNVCLKTVSVLFI
jgi:hypothetical protein